MTTRTSISKKRLAQLLAIESIHAEFCEALQALADAECSGGTVKSFTDRAKGLEICINTNTHNITDYTGKGAY